MKRKNMHKKKFVFFVLLVIIIFYLYNDKKISSNSNSNMFAVEDTSSISKIFLADRNGTSILLEKNKNNWILNKKYDVKKSSINILLSTIKDIRVHKSVPINATNNIIKDIATNGIKVEIYSNKKNKLLRSYTLGQPTADYLSNYIINNDEETPYIVNIPGFNGFLTPRYGVQVNNLDINSWRSTLIFKKSAKKINNLSLTNFLDSSKSFSINNKECLLYDFKQNQVKVNKNIIDKYVKVCSKLNCESYSNINKFNDYNKLLYEISIDTDTLKIYELNRDLLKYKEHNYNVKRMLGVLNNNQYMLIQAHVFNKVLINIDEFVN
ncbi:MAG: hypothetical protein CMD36_05735 [Flavobacteriales bacterium]|nr:hypothetical protein [Flavobacteriales bacterium]|tara:strand:+ start:674 stop:1642 length:969 start_codon:yes stop_codon:yes gene_type:complete